MTTMPDKEYNLGVQPIDAVMSRAGLSNSTVVGASGEMLTHKVVQKARKGRRLTRRTQEKVMRAVNRAAPGENFTVEALFNYRGT